MQLIPRVAGSDGSAVTITVKTTAGVVAPASGTDQLTATLDLKGTADTLQTGTMIATPTDIFPGNTVAIDVTGTLTVVVAHLTVHLMRKA